MKIELEFESQQDLARFATLLKYFHDQLSNIEYAYCCDDSLYNDMAIIDSVYRQLRGDK